MGKRITLLRARMSYKRRDRAQVYGTPNVVCIYGWLKRPQTSKNKIVLSCMLEVERALVSGLVTQRIADLHEKTAETLCSDASICIYDMHENNAKLGNGDCLCHVSDTFVDVLCLALFIAFLCGWGTVAFYGELSE